jgi:hypothetical protein
MDDKEYRRLRRLLVVCIVAICVLVVGIAIYGSVQISQLRSQVDSLNVPTVVPRDGKDGLNGVTETITTQLPGKDGKDGQNATDSQVQKAVDNFLVANPPKGGADGKDGKDGVDGQKGDPGAPGLVMFVRQNPFGLWECKFGNDSGWSPIEECQ